MEPFHYVLHTNQKKKKSFLELFIKRFFKDPEWFFYGTEAKHILEPLFFRLYEWDLDRLLCSVAPSTD